MVKCIKWFNKGEIDADTSSEMGKQILVDEFAIENFNDQPCISEKSCSK